MSWMKVDDALAYHPKVMAAGLAPMGLWLRAGAWASAHPNDGFVPTTLLATLGAKKSHADALVKAGLWHVEDGGYRFHDWLDYQPSAAQAKKEQEAASASGSLGNHRRWHVRRGITDLNCEFCKGAAS